MKEYGIKSIGLKSSKLIELCVEKNGVQTGPFGSQLHNKDYVAVGTPIITVEHLGENFISHENTPKVSNLDKERLKKYILKKGDIVFSRVGSVDRRAWVSDKEDGWLFSGRCLRVRTNPELLDSLYLSYFLGLEGVKNYLRGVAVGATMPSINTKILSNITIYYPEIEKQKRISSFLKLFDDKIHLNHQINQTLEAIAQAIFKSWFIDFDPVKAKAETLAQGGSQEEAELAAMCTISGKSTEALQHMQTTHPEQYQKLQKTAAAFPAAFVDSELGEIPEGWEVRQVNDFAKIIGGRQLDKSKIKESGNIPVFGGAGIMGYTEKHNAEGFVISIGRVGAYCGQFFSHRGKAYINNNASLIKQKDENLGEWLFISLKNADIEAIKKGAAQPFVSNTDVGNLKLLWGGESMNNYFRFYLNDLYKNMEQRNIESSSLANLRDTLLPELLNGGLS